MKVIKNLIRVLFILMLFLSFSFFKTETQAKTILSDSISQDQYNEIFNKIEMNQQTMEVPESYNIILVLLMVVSTTFKIKVQVSIGLFPLRWRKIKKFWKW